MKMRGIAISLFAVITAITLCAFGSAQTVSSNGNIVKLRTSRGQTVILRRVKHGAEKNLSATMAAPKPDVEINLPQGDGVVEIMGGEDGNSNPVTVNFIADITKWANGGYLTMQIVAPNGNTIGLDTFQLEGCASCEGTISINMWSGIIPLVWPNGQTQFQTITTVNNQTGAAVGILNRFEYNPAPLNITGVTQATNANGQTVLDVYGLGPITPGSNTPVIVSGLIPISTANLAVSPQDGSLLVTIPANANIQAGATTLTVCNEGLCASTVYIALGFGQNGGKG